MSDKFTISGVVDEKFDFKEFRQCKGKEMHIFCKDVVRISSAGLKEWLDVFKGLRGSGKSIKFFEVSPVIVRQTVYVSGIIEPKEVLSLCVEYACANCHNRELKVYTPLALEKMNFELASIECPKCKRPMVFDDLNEKYFSFLKKSNVAS